MSHIDPVLMTNPDELNFFMKDFCRIQFFLPDRQMSHLLPDGKMPCPWHGISSSCVIKNAILIPNGPRNVYDTDNRAVRTVQLASFQEINLCRSIRPYIPRACQG